MKCFTQFLSATVLALTCCASFAQATAAAPAGELMSTRDFFRNPSYLAPSLSPNGEHLAVLAPVDGRMNIIIINMKTRDGKQISTYKNFDVTSLEWISNDRIIFTIGNIGEPSGFAAQRGGGLFAANRDGTGYREISPSVATVIARGSYVYRGHSYLGRVPESTTEIFTVSNERTLEAADVYKVDTVSGRKQLQTFDNPGNTVGFVVDGKGHVRFATAAYPDASSGIFYRENNDAKWREVGRFKVGQDAWTPVEFHPTKPNLVYVSSNIGRDKSAILEMDTADMKPGKVVASHPVADLSGGLVFDSELKELVGVRYDAAKPGTIWLDTRYQTIQRAMDGAMADMVNEVSRIRNTSQYLVRSFSDRKASEWLLFDSQARKLEPLLESRPWVKPESLVQQIPVMMKQRDGTEILGYYFLPRGYKKGDKVPLIVNIHGGPWVKADSWEYAMWGAVESQFFASRGYAVLMPNFRGTAGLGTKVLMGGQKQFGKVMQEDVEDGVAWAIKEGFADPNKVCIYGASYGGYAALAGPAKTPDMFKCAVAALAVTDIELLLTSSQGDIPPNRVGASYWAAMVGDPKTEKELLRAASPVYQADKIKAKVFLISGESDIRVPLEQAERMRAALRRAGNEPRWMVKADEGHGFGKIENRVEKYNAMLEFFNEHIGPQKK
jgi:dipeptidyl aminopeptidase/acylaminoacyl peptidase